MAVDRRLLCGVAFHRLGCLKQPLGGVGATIENDVLDEFCRTGLYRPRGSAETHATSSPSMDISKASNFERYVFDIVRRDPAVVRALWQRIGVADRPTAALALAWLLSQGERLTYNPELYA